MMHVERLNLSRFELVEVIVELGEVNNNSNCWVDHKEFLKEENKKQYYLGLIPKGLIIDRAIEDILGSWMGVVKVQGNNG